MTKLDIIDALGMEPHPEGGYFCEVYRSKGEVPGAVLGNMFNCESRSFSTAIYFLLEKGNFSAFHRIKSDELWHHYEGVGLEVLVIRADGRLETLRLGKNIAAGERPMHIAPGGCWFASRVVEEGFALVGCTVSPGFDFADFELASRDQLVSSYPQHQEVIEALTRG